TNLDWLIPAVHFPILTPSREAGDPLFFADRETPPAERFAVVISCHAPNFAPGPASRHEAPGRQARSPCRALRAHRRPAPPDPRSGEFRDRSVSAPALARCPRSSSDRRPCRSTSQALPPWPLRTLQALRP